MIEVKNLTKTYKTGNKALKGINIQIQDGEFVFIMGRSGSGKSTLLKLLLKELEPTSGQIIVNDMDLEKMPRRYIPKYRRRLGMVFQDFRLLKDKTVYENVAFAQRVIGVSPREIKKNVPEMLRLVGLSSKYKAYPNQLSGGEQQRVAIARALINSPEILLADEPTGNLDVHNSMEIMELLEEINRRGTTVLVVTHSREITTAVSGMKISTLIYCTKEGMRNIIRNIWFSLASVAIISACIFLFCMFFGLIANVQYMVRNAESTVGITVFFNEDMSEDDIQKIGDEIRARDEVKEVKYVSAEEAWENFKKEYFKGVEDLAEGFADDNPLAGSASYEIYLKDIDMQDDMVAWLGTVQGIRKINYSSDTASGLSSFNKMLGLLSGVIIAILLAVAIFLISNTITTAAAFRREENRIMRLIGATNFMIRAPFVVQGVMIGLVGALIPLAITYFLYRQAVVYMMERFDILSNLIEFIPIQTIFPSMVAVAMALGVGIGFVGSFFTIRRHLKV